MEMIQTHLEQRDGNDCFIRNYYMFIPDKRVVIQTTTYSNLDQVNVSTWNNPDNSLPEPVRAWFGCGKINTLPKRVTIADLVYAQKEPNWAEEREQHWSGDN